MSFGERPVASFGQRAVYKTEFDLFKQNSDIDLISLVSYKDDTSKQKPDQDAQQQARESRERFIKTRFLETKDKQFNKVQSRKPISYQRSTNVVLHSRKGIDDTRESKSASGLRVYGSVTERNRQDTRSQTTCGFRRTDQKLYSNTSNKKNKSQTTSGIRRNEYKYNSNTHVSRIGNKNICKERKREQSWNISTHVGKQRSHSVYGYRRNENPSDVRDNEQDNNTDTQTNGCDKLNIDSKYRGIRAKVNTSNPNVNITRRTKSAIVSVNYGNTQTGNNINKPKSANVRLNVNSKDKCDNVKELDKLKNGNFTVESKSKEAFVETLTNGLTVIPLEHITDEQKETLTESAVDCGFPVDETSPQIGNEQIEPACEADIKSNTTEGLNRLEESFGTDDFVGSKDSGFVSSADTPERRDKPDTGTVKVKDESGELKHVTFNFANTDEIDIKSDVGSDVATIDEDEDAGSGNEPFVDVNELIRNLELRDSDSKLGDGSVSIYSEKDSLCGESEHKLLHSESTKKVETESNETETVDLAKTGKAHMINPKDLTMSKEARFAIMETLHDMRGDGRRGSKCNGSAGFKHKGVTAQRRIKDNRYKYDQFMRDRTSTFIRNQNGPIDSVAKYNDGNGSTFSSENTKDCDESSSEEIVKSKLFPSIGDTLQIGKKTKTNLTSLTTQTNIGKVYTLEQAKKKKYKIPGIGNYNLVTSPENDFEITPPGFDSRYDARAIISKEESEPPPRFIQDQSIQKCKSWLRNVNLSPLSLNPVINPKR